MKSLATFSKFIWSMGVLWMCANMMLFRWFWPDLERTHVFTRLITLKLLSHEAVGKGIVWYSMSNLCVCGLATFAADISLKISHSVDTLVTSLIRISAVALYKPMIAHLGVLLASDLSLSLHVNEITLIALYKVQLFCLWQEHICCLCPCWPTCHRQALQTKNIVILQLCLILRISLHILQ